MKKVLSFFLCVILLLVVNGCGNISEEERREMEREMRIKAVYADSLSFETFCELDDSRLIVGEVAFILTIENRKKPEAEWYRYVVFVNSMEEAKQYLGTNTLAAWPSEMTPRALAALNVWFAEATSENWKERGGRHVPIPESLSFPVTMEDVMDNWEAVNELRMALRGGATSDMRDAGVKHGSWAEGGGLRERAIELGVWPEDNVEIENKND